MIRDLTQSMNVLRSETSCKPVDRMCELFALLQAAVRRSACSAAGMAN